MSRRRNNSSISARISKEVSARDSYRAKMNQNGSGHSNFSRSTNSGNHNSKKRNDLKSRIEYYNRKALSRYVKQWLLLHHKNSLHISNKDWQDARKAYHKHLVDRLKYNRAHGNNHSYGNNRNRTKAGNTSYSDHRNNNRSRFANQKSHNNSHKDAMRDHFEWIRQKRLNKFAGEWAAKHHKAGQKFSNKDWNTMKKDYQSEEYNKYFHGKRNGHRRKSRSRASQASNLSLSGMASTPKYSRGYAANSLRAKHRLINHLEHLKRMNPSDRPLSKSDEAKMIDLNLFRSGASKYRRQSYASTHTKAGRRQPKYFRSYYTANVTPGATNNKAAYQAGFGSSQWLAIKNLNAMKRNENSIPGRGKFAKFLRQLFHYMAIMNAHIANDRFFQNADPKHFSRICHRFGREHEEHHKFRKARRQIKGFKRDIDTDLYNQGFRIDSELASLTGQNGNYEHSGRKASPAPVDVTPGGSNASNKLGLISPAIRKLLGFGGGDKSLGSGSSHSGLPSGGPNRSDDGPDL